MYPLQVDLLFSVENRHYIALKKHLDHHKVDLQATKNILYCSKGTEMLQVCVFDEAVKSGQKTDITVHPDQLMREPGKMSAIILSRLKLNVTIFARSCVVKQIDKETAKNFLDSYHIMNSTQSAFNLGLFYKEELVALASFSKGRKMNRLNDDERSFELIRFCCKAGITVTGGLTRLLKHFCNHKKAGDIMTYVDKQLSDGSSFIRAGFKRYSETEPNYFLVNKKSYERIPAEKETVYDPERFYLSHNEGNIKLVYTP